MEASADVEQGTKTTTCDRVGLSMSLDRLSDRIHSAGKIFDRVNSTASLLEERVDRLLRKADQENTIIDLLEALRRKDKRFSLFFLICMKLFLREFIKKYMALNESSVGGDCTPSTPSANARTREISDFLLAQTAVLDRENSGDDGTVVANTKTTFVELCKHFGMSGDELRCVTLIGDITSWNSRKPKVTGCLQLLPTELDDVLHIIKVNVEDQAFMEGAMRKIAKRYVEVTTKQELDTLIVGETTQHSVEGKGDDSQANIEDNIEIGPVPNTESAHDIQTEVSVQEGESD